MKTFLLLISVICFISAYGSHMFAKNDPLGWCGYMINPVLSAIPWISGFVLAVIPEVILLEDVFWIWIFLGNAVLVFILGPAITQFVLRRIASGKGAGVDIIVSLIIGFTTLGISFII